MRPGFLGVFLPLKIGKNCLAPINVAPCGVFIEGSGLGGGVAPLGEGA